MEETLSDVGILTVAITEALFNCEFPFINVCPDFDDSTVAVELEPLFNCLFTSLTLMFFVVWLFQSSKPMLVFLDESILFVKLSNSS